LTGRWGGVKAGATFVKGELWKAENGNKSDQEVFVQFSVSLSSSKHSFQLSAFIFHNFP
jgi:hypothetical protein